MFEIRKHDVTHDALGEIDHVPAPLTLIQEAERLADEKRKTHFIGVCDRNTAPAGRPATFMLTGEFVLSDDRQAVLNHGCGRLLWITPTVPGAYTAPEIYRRAPENRHELQTMECACCHKDIPVVQGSTFETAGRIERGYLAAQNVDGTLTPDELSERENIKFNCYICPNCFLTDPDLCRFFNKIGLQVR